MPRARPHADLRDTNALPTAPLSFAVACLLQVLKPFRAYCRYPVIHAEKPPTTARSVLRSDLCLLYRFSITTKHNVRPKNASALSDGRDAYRRKNRIVKSQDKRLGQARKRQDRTIDCTTNAWRIKKATRTERPHCVTSL